MIFDKFVGFATEEEMLTESAKMVENNTLWGGEILKKKYLLCKFCVASVISRAHWYQHFLHCFIPVL